MDEISRTASIVLVDDNPADVLLIRKALREQGIKCELTCFENGEMALRNLSQKGRLLPDLILLDLHLPQADGEVLSKIRGMPRFSDVPVIILTSSESCQDMQRPARLGSARYIRRPSKLEDFFREVGCGVEEMLRRGKNGRAWASEFVLLFSDKGWLAGRVCVAPNSSGQTRLPAQENPPSSASIPNSHHSCPPSSRTISSTMRAVKLVTE